MQFDHTPGIYYEKIGHLHQVTGTWKLVIKLDITDLDDRIWQIHKYIEQTNEMCSSIRAENDVKRTCNNLKNIINNDSKTLAKITTLINTLYKTRINKRRGIIDGIGSITKTLFGIMDANDRNLINEQIQLLQNNQQTLEHAAKNQLNIINSTIIHLAKLENILDYNGKLINHYVREYTTREEIDEHFTVIIAMTTDLIRDAKDILEYLTYIRKGTMHPLLTPINEIISYLREAVLQLPRGSYFPFNIKIDKWLEIEKYAKINAYYDKTNVYTILKFPIIAQPMFEILNVIPLPIFNYDKFMYTEISNKLIAINKETHSHLILTEQDLKECISSDNIYVCEKSYPKYYDSENTPCEVKIYTQKQNYRDQCNVRQMKAIGTIWITLQQPHTWLYSTIAEQQIKITCNDYPEYKKIIRKTGRITLHDNCKMVTTDMTIQTKTITYTTNIETFLPEFNITIPETNDKQNNEQKFKEITHNPLELKDLSNKLKEINEDLNHNKNNFFKQKQFIYPMASSGVTTIIIIILIIWIIIQNKRKTPNKQTTIE